MEEEKKISSETLFTKVIPKMNKSGSRQVGSMKIEVKTFEEFKFIQMSQTKEAFGQVGSDEYKPAKETWVTFDPKNKEIKDALSEAFKR